MPEYLYYAGIFAPLLFIIYSIIKYLGRLTVKRKNISAARFTFNVAEGHRSEAQRKLLASIRAVFGEEATLKIAKGILWEKMPAYLLLAAKGRPGKTDENLVDGMRFQKMYFGGSKKTGKKFELEVSLTNNEVTGWRDL